MRRTALALRPRSWSEIRALASRTFAPWDEQAGQATTNLLAWCQARGMKAPQAHPYAFPEAEGGFGLAASRDLAAGDLVLTIPKAVWDPNSAQTCLDHALTRAPAFGQRMEGALPKQSPQDMHDRLELVASLAMHVMINGSEPYVHWLQVTQGPSSFIEHMPPFWPDDRFADFQASVAGTNVQKFAGFSKALHETLFGADGVDVETPIPEGAPPPKLMLWALTVVQSRAVSGRGFPFTMVPYFDLLNHSFTPNCNHTFDSASGEFRVTATRPILESQQCLISYGDMSNALLFKKYGFVLQDNSHEEVLLDQFDMNAHLVQTIEDTEDELVSTMREELMKKHGERVIAQDMAVGARTHALSAPLIRFLRASCATLADAIASTRPTWNPATTRFLMAPHEEEEIRRNDPETLADMVDVSGPLANPEAELQCLRLQREIVASHAARYTTTLEHDLKLEQEADEAWRRTAATVLVGEKRVLKATLARIDDKILRLPAYYGQAP